MNNTTKQTTYQDNQHTYTTKNLHIYIYIYIYVYIYIYTYTHVYMIGHNKRKGPFQMSSAGLLENRLLEVIANSLYEL